MISSFILKQTKIRSGEQGFTLIELLVVIIIIGILAAISLPSFLNQAAKAKQSEAKLAIGSVNRAQQAYRIENTTFAATMDDLKIGLPTKTTDYTYNLNANEVQAEVTATPSDPTTLLAYSGLVGILRGQTTVTSCQTLAPSKTPPDTGLTVKGAECINGESMR